MGSVNVEELDGGIRNQFRPWGLICEDCGRTTRDVEYLTAHARTLQLICDRCLLSGRWESYRRWPWPIGVARRG